VSGTLNRLGERGVVRDTLRVILAVSIAVVGCDGNDAMPRADGDGDHNGWVCLREVTWSSSCKI
jgi:hypothetical protein